VSEKVARMSHWQRGPLLLCLSAPMVTAWQLHWVPLWFLGASLASQTIFVTLFEACAAAAATRVTVGELIDHEAAS
jgi:hypothetical protein